MNSVQRTGLQEQLAVNALFLCIRYTGMVIAGHIWWLAEVLAVEEVSLVRSGDTVHHLSHLISVLILIMLPTLICPTL